MRSSSAAFRGCCRVLVALILCCYVREGLAFASTTRRPLQSTVSSFTGSQKRHTRSSLFTVSMSRESDNDNTSTTMSRNQALQRMLQQDGLVVEDDKDQLQRREIFNTVINISLVAAIAAWGWSLSSLFMTSIYTPSGFQRLPTTQFIVALGDPKASSGKISEPWGLWRADPGPRGVYLRDYDKQLVANNNISPVGWKFSSDDWWLEEHGIIMEQPEFPLAPGRYLVTGGRTTTTGLTIDKQGNWKLDEGTLYDVTHLPCRSARYKPLNADASPKSADLKKFPVIPGAEMPAVEGYSKQDYAVLFLVGKAV